jgi:predicted transcriptional regulator
MAKKLPRARKTKVTNKQRVADFIDEHPGCTKNEICKVLKLTRQQVDASIIQLRRQNFFHSDHQFATAKRGHVDTSFSIQEVVTVKKIGIEKTKQILRLLEQLQ